MEANNLYTFLSLLDFTSFQKNSKKKREHILLIAIYTRFFLIDVLNFFGFFLMKSFLFSNIVEQQIIIEIEVKETHRLFPSSGVD